MPGPAVNENEFELLDVVIELVYAGEYLANGGGGVQRRTAEEIKLFKGLVLDKQRSLLSMAIQKEDGVQIGNYFKLVKLAFNYEAWDAFRRMAYNLVSFIEV